MRRYMPGVLGIIVTSVLAACAGFAWSPHHDAPEVRHTLPACAEEDSHDCYWDGSSRNGEGRSFVDIEGVVYYLPESR